MKNLHLIPTDKPSRLVKFFTNKFHLCKEILPIQDEEQYQHIYITSGEEIKDAKWIIHNGKIHEVTKNKGLYISVKELSHIDIRADLCKKIILTTDQDLIKDDVQAIDDEFLEWYVKNPSCEEVEVEFLQLNKLTGELGASMYKIIIPREEPKQETLEEAAERLYPIILEDDGWDKNKQYRDEWIEGVKWHAEQDKNKYSEKEVLKLLKDYNEHTLKLQALKLGNSFNVEDWFEQFKKK